MYRQTLLTRYQLYIFLIIIPTVLIGQSEYYPGVIKLTTDFSYSCGFTLDDKANTYYCKSDTFTLNFYSFPTSGIPTKKLSVYYSFVNNDPVKKVIQKDFRSWLNSRLVRFDSINGYLFIYLTCKEKKDDWYSVIVNDTTNEVLWINDKRFIKFLSWEKLRSKKYDVRIHPRSKAYANPDTTSNPVSLCFLNDYSIEKVKGAWMKVKLDIGEPCDGSKVIEKYGWVPFRNENILKIIYDIDVW